MHPAGVRIPASHSLQICHPRWGWKGFFHTLGRLGIVHSSLQPRDAAGAPESPNREVGDRSFQPTTEMRPRLPNPNRQKMGKESYSPQRGGIFVEARVAAAAPQGGAIFFCVKRKLQP
jgi:hypothetical protein